MSDIRDVKVGDCVGFKSDIEQCGIVTKIHNGHYGREFTLRAPTQEGFNGDYIGGQMKYAVRADDCWEEDY